MSTCGVSSSIALTEGGGVWTCGGEGKTQLVLVPPATFDGSKVVYVATCSQSVYSNKHSLILGSDNRVWACDLAHHCALGMVDTVNLLESTLLADVTMFAEPGRQNFWVYIIVSNLIANLKIVQRISVFTDFVCFYWLSHAYFSKYLKRLRSKRSSCRLLPAYHVPKEM